MITIVVIHPLILYMISIIVVVYLVQDIIIIIAVNPFNPGHDHITTIAVFFISRYDHN